MSDPTLEIEIAITPANGRRLSGRPPLAPPPPRIPRTARLMALAIRFQGLVDNGEVRDYADLARFGYVTRARLTQVMNLLLLAPELQEALLWCDGMASGIGERELRVVTSNVCWEDQRQRWRELSQHHPLV